MPIAIPPRLTTNLKVVVPNAVAGEDITAATAVALLDEGGTKVWRPCGARVINYSRSFAGFAGGTVSAGDNFPLISGRGSYVTPIVEGSVLLTPDEPVFLSLTPGEVTQTAPQTEHGVAIVRLGLAVSTTQILLKTEVSMVIP
jgi:hypothetical protein